MSYQTWAHLERPPDRADDGHDLARVDGVGSEVSPFEAVCECGWGSAGWSGPVAEARAKVRLEHARHRLERRRGK